MTCAECGGRMTIVGKTHKYEESGLPNVVLVGVEVRRCSKCREEEVSIPNIEGLHRCIAQTIATRRTLLSGAEIRFLRKFLGYSGRDFAGLLGVAPETVSRWENEKQPLAPGVDRAMRLLALYGQQVENYSGFAFLKDISTTRPKRPKGFTLRLRSNHWQSAA